MHYADIELILERRMKYPRTMNLKIRMNGLRAHWQFLSLLLEQNQKKIPVIAAGAG